MYLCEEIHPEICHEDYDCPFCKSIKGKDDEIKELEGRIDKLKKDIDELLEEKEQKGGINYDL